jgi:hypothetical protein
MSEVIKSAKTRKNRRFPLPAAATKLKIIALPGWW